jgi:phosphate transport system substrate-binding protein
VTRSSIRRAILPAAVALTLGAAATGCTAGSAAQGDSGDTLTGGGSTAQALAQDAWRAAFQKANQGDSVTYEQVGSGTGVTNFNSGTYAFAGSDAYLDGSAVGDAKKRCGGQDAIEVPAYISPIAIAYNLPGVPTLHLSADVIADMFSGRITTWNDPKIEAENSGVDLPSTTIVPLHRSDGSGTTWNFTDYLSQASDGAWSWEAGEDWPTSIKAGQGFEGTSGVVGGLKQTKGAVGYIDNSAMTEPLTAAAIKVGERWNTPSAQGASKVVGMSKSISGRPAGDMALDIARTATAKGGYPLLLTSYLIACPHYDDSTQGALVKKYLTYVLSAEGQTVGSQAAKSAALPPAMARKAGELVDAIT